jgi:nicotinamidase-related amidase
MTAADDDSPSVELILLGTPSRVLEAVIPSREMHAELAQMRETLGVYGLSVLDAEAPPAALRQRIVQALQARADSARRALVVIDMIQDYLTPGQPLFISRAKEIVPALAARIAKARSEGEPVVYVHDYHDASDTDLEHWPLHAVEGTSGWMMVDELAPKDGDVLVRHRTYSGFFETDLHQQLQRLSVGKLVMTGCATELQLFATATDALMRGYQVEVPSGLHAGTSEEAELAALRTLSVMRPTPPRL